MVMDACRAEDLADHDAATARVPAFLLPDVPDADRLRMRPDILRVLGLPATPTEEQIESACISKHRHTVQVVEVGYTSDTRWLEKVQEKKAQHARLVAALTVAGWTVESHVILVGHYGTVYKSGRAALLELGLSKADASSLLEELSVQAVVAAHEIGMARRRLERTRGRDGVG